MEGSRSERREDLCGEKEVGVGEEWSPMADDGRDSAWAVVRGVVVILVDSTSDSWSVTVRETSKGGGGVTTRVVDGGESPGVE